MHPLEPVLDQADLHPFFMAKTEIQVRFWATNSLLRSLSCCLPCQAKQPPSKERLFRVFWLVLIGLSACLSLDRWTTPLDSGWPHVVWLAPCESLHEGVVDGCEVGWLAKS